MRVRCTRPFWTGCTSADPTSDRRTLPELAREPTLYLIPECDTEEDVHEVLRELCDEIFVEQWAGWLRDEETWPEDRGFHVFCRWLISNTIRCWSICPTNH